MNFSRRQFLGLMGAAGLAGCARTKDVWQSTKNAVTSLEMPVISGDGPFYVCDCRRSARVGRAEHGHRQPRGGHDQRT
jgi:hypothetical protein